MVQQRVWGYIWRSSSAFVTLCITTAVFGESFLYGFIVPILPFILEDRNHVDPADIQRVTYEVFAVYGAVAVLSGIAIGYAADQVSSRRTPLILGLEIAFVGTTALATATKLPAVYMGRALQAVGSTATFIVGYATLRDCIEGANIGKTLGLANSFQSAGSLSGPAIAGIFFELAGYWASWGAVLLVILLNIVMRLVMVEKPRKKPRCADVGTRDRSVSSSATTTPPAVREVLMDDDTLLPSTSVRSYGSTVGKDTSLKQQNISMMSFYKVLLSQPRVVVGLVSYNVPWYIFILSNIICSPNRVVVP
ncbi:major facilitator superfamily domain-containing protein [Aspergillus californicus]